MELSSEHIVDESDGIKLPYFFIICCLLFIILLGVIVYLFKQNQELTRTSIKRSNQSEETLPIPTAQEISFSVSQDISDQIHTILRQVIDDTLPYPTPTDGVQIFSKDFELSKNDPWANMVFHVYRYKPGMVLSEGYEGTTWDRDMDKEVQKLKALSKYTKGTYISESISSTDPTTFEAVTVKDINTVHFVITDTYFPPSRSWHRYYRAYDEKTKQIIEIVMGYQKDGAQLGTKSICYQEKCAELLIFSKETDSYLKDEEGALLVNKEK